MAYAVALIQKPESTFAFAERSRRILTTFDTNCLRQGFALRMDRVPFRRAARALCQEAKRQCCCHQTTVRRRDVVEADEREREQESGSENEIESYQDNEQQSGQRHRRGDLLEESNQDNEQQLATTVPHNLSIQGAIREPDQMY